METTKKRSGKKALAVVLLLGTGVSAGVTFSAFTSVRHYGGNDLAAAEVTLSGDSTAAFEFDVANMKPGTAAERCVSITYTGGANPDIRLYGTTTGGLAQYVDLTVTRSVAAVDTTNGSCTNFVDGTATSVFATGLLNSYPSTYAGGITQAGWTTALTRSYKIRVQLRADAPDAASGQTSTTQYSWEAR